MIKAVIFDLGGVVLKGSTESFLKKAENILGKKGRLESKSYFDKKMQLGKSSLRAGLERVFSKKMDDQEFIQIAKAWMANWQPDPEMIGLAKSLKKKYRLAILSNSEKSYEEKYGPELKKIFPVILYSHRERMLKPSQEFFELALKRLGTGPEETIMVDDTKENEKPCSQLGIHFIHYKNTESLKKRLELYGATA